MKNDRFVHLHLHSDYSLLDGACRIDKLIEHVRGLGMSAVALTDHGNLFGAVQFHDEALSKGIKPIIGCEAYVADTSHKDRSGGPESNRHIVLLVENAEGYRNLIKLVSIAYLEGFYYKPRIDKDLLSQHHRGLIALSGCLKGVVNSHLLADDFQKAAIEALDYREIFGKDSFFLEIQNHGLKDESKINPQIIEISRRAGIPLVATNDAHYIKRSDSLAHDILICIQTGKTQGDTDRLRFEADEFYVKSYDEMLQALGDLPQALTRTVEIASRCDFQFEAGQLHLPHFEVPAGYTTDSYFEKVVRQGWQQRRAHLQELERRGLLKNPLSAYEERLNYEIEVIKKMRFSSYFLIVWDFIRFARERKIPVGPGRGSVVGSLVAYCMRIIDVDPLQYNLLFERFLNPERLAPPDIDIDFCMRRRNEVINYVAEKYGRDCVSQIITFGTLAARAAIRDVGRALGLPYNEVDRIAKLVPNELNTTIEKALASEPQLSKLMSEREDVRKLIEIARDLEGFVRHVSTHAAGVVISPQPLTELVPLYRSNKAWTSASGRQPTADGKVGASLWPDEVTTQFAMTDLERIGLLKMDFLALATLTVIDDALKQIREQRGIDLDLSSIPLDDQRTYELFASGKTDGIFQFESSGMKEALRKLRPDNFEDLIALNALYRPGPMEMIDEYSRRKHNKVQVRYELPQLKEILEGTYGLIIFQEQVMEIAKKVAGYTLGEADILRKAMGKKKPEVMRAQREKFIAGAIKNGISEKQAEKLFATIERFAGYAFNRSHSAAYAMLAYQTAYLKAHYPVEFMAALLTSEIGKAEKVAQYIAEARQMGIEILPPDINQSEANFVASNGAIRFGLAAVKNVGEGAIESIVAARKRLGRFSSIYQLCENVDLRLVNRRVLESLIKAGAFDSLGAKRAQIFRVVNRALEHGQRTQRARERLQNGLFGDVFASGGPPVREAWNPAGGAAEELPDVEEWPEGTRLSYEKEVLGFYISGHPLNRFADELKDLNCDMISTLRAEGLEREATLAGLVTSLRRLRTKKGDQMCVFTLEDLTASIEVVVFPSLYDRSSELIVPDAPLLVRGRCTIEGDNLPRVIAAEVESLVGVRERRARLVTIVAQTTKLKMTSAEELYALFEANRGDCPVEIYLEKPQEFRVRIQVNGLFKVRPSRELFDKIESICGRGSVRIKT